MRPHVWCGRVCAGPCVCVGVRVVYVLMGVAVVRGLVGEWLRDMDKKTTANSGHTGGASHVHMTCDSAFLAL